MSHDGVCIPAREDVPCAPRLRQHVPDAVDRARKMSAAIPRARVQLAPAGRRRGVHPFVRSIQSPLSKSPTWLTFACARATLIVHGCVQHLGVPLGAARNPARTPRPRDAPLRINGVACEPPPVRVDRAHGIGNQRVPQAREKGKHRGESRVHFSALVLKIADPRVCCAFVSLVVCARVWLYRDSGAHK